jgi:hypothetical protein
LPFFAADAALKEAKDRALSGFVNREVLRRKAIVAAGMLAHPRPRFRPAIRAGPVTIRKKMAFMQLALVHGTKSSVVSEIILQWPHFLEDYQKFIHPKIAFNSCVNAGSKFFSHCESGIGIVIISASLFYSSLKRGDSCFAESLYNKETSFFRIPLQ